MNTDIASFALGTFREGSSPAFLGLVVPTSSADAVVPLADVAQALGLRESAPDSLDGALGDWGFWSAEIASIAAAALDAGLGHPALAAVARSVAELQVLAPFRPRQIIQAGANYRSHVIEMMLLASPDDGRPAAERRADAERQVDQRTVDGRPFLFMGSPSAVCGANDGVVLPDLDGQHDWELELAVVIGSRARHVAADDALGYVAGYTIANDLTSRAWLRRTDVPALGIDWLRAKNWPTALPLGPYMALADTIGDPAALALELRLNGDVMQRADVSDMLYGVAELIAYASSLTVLGPGDLLLTGSPSGNGIQLGRLLGDGDVIEASITGLGRQRNVCSVAAPRTDRALAEVEG